MVIITERQKKDLHTAILEYLLSEKEEFPRSIEVFKEEAKIDTEPDLTKCILVKKWTSVVRLQKQVLELQAKLDLALLNNSFSSQQRPGSVVSNDGSTNDRMIPRAPARCTLNGHRAPITSIAIHPKYSIFSSASEDTTIKIWDYETTQLERTLKGHTGVVTALSFDSTGDLLVSSSTDMSAKIWDMGTYSCIKTLKGHDHAISSILFTPNNDHIYTCSRDHTIKCWEVQTGYCIKTLTNHSDWVKCISISMDGEFIASGGLDQSIIVWKLSSGQKIQVILQYNRLKYDYFHFCFILVVVFCGSILQYFFVVSNNVSIFILH